MTRPVRRILQILFILVIGIAPLVVLGWSFCKRRVGHGFAGEFAVMTKATMSSRTIGQRSLVEKVG